MIPLHPTSRDVVLAHDDTIHFPWVDPEAKTGAYVRVDAAVLVRSADLLSGAPVEVVGVQSIRVTVADLDEGDVDLTVSSLALTVPAARALWSTLGRGLTAADALLATIPAPDAITQSEEPT